MTIVVGGFVQRRLKRLAIEKARFVLQYDHGLGGDLLDGAMFALEAVDSAHDVWVLASGIIRNWRGRRCEVQCARAGPCLVCTREYTFGQVHWCLPPYDTRDFVPKQEDATT